MQKPDFWNNIEESNAVNKELSTLKKELSLYNKVSKDIKENKEIIELLEIEYSEEIYEDLKNAINDCDSLLKDLEINTTLKYIRVLEELKAVTGLQCYYVCMKDFAIKWIINMKF